LVGDEAERRSVAVDEVLGVGSEGGSAGDARRQRLFVAKCFRSATALAALGVLRPGARVHLRLQVQRGKASDVCFASTQEEIQGSRV